MFVLVHKGEIYSLLDENLQTFIIDMCLLLGRILYQCRTDIDMSSVVWLLINGTKIIKIVSINYKHQNDFFLINFGLYEIQKNALYTYETKLP